MAASGFGYVSVQITRIGIQKSQKLTKPMVSEQRGVLLRVCRSFFLSKYGHRSGIYERTISLRFLGIILRVLRLEASVYNVYITNQFQTTVDQGGGGKIL
jgi:hypothetical protein